MKQLFLIFSILIPYVLFSQSDRDLIIEKGSTKVITEPTLVLNSFIMEDNSTIKLELKEGNNWAVIATEAFIGENCKIIGNGKEGNSKEDKPQREGTGSNCDKGADGFEAEHGENGRDGIDIFLSFSIKELKSLAIYSWGGKGGDGGKGGKGQKGGRADRSKRCNGNIGGTGGRGGNAGLGGNGGDVAIEYFSDGIIPNFNSGNQKHTIEVSNDAGRNGEIGKGGEGGDGGDSKTFDIGIATHTYDGGAKGQPGIDGNKPKTSPINGKLSWVRVEINLKGEKQKIANTDPELINFTIGGEYYAIIMGCGEYIYHPEKNLNYPIPDSETFRDILKSNYYFKKIEYLPNPNREDIMDVLDKYSKLLKENDNLLIFYTGHGEWSENKKQGYWKPSNAKWSSSANWISNSDIRDGIESFSCKHVLLISDACFSGTLILKPKSKGDDEVSRERQLYKLNSRKAMTSGAFETVPDKSEFNKYLFKYLRENKKKKMSAMDLFSNVEKSVMSESDDVTPQHLPIFNVGHQGGDFIFIRKD